MEMERGVGGGVMNAAAVWATELVGAEMEMERGAGGGVMNAAAAAAAQSTVDDDDDAVWKAILDDDSERTPADVHRKPCE